jgi:hypothetical protein
MARGARVSGSLKGDKELKARLKAIGQVFKPVARQWAAKDRDLMRPMVPVQTGRLRKSFRVSSVSAKRARVLGHYTAYFVDAGPKAHVITAKRHPFMVFKAGNKTIFARKVHHRGYRARPFRQRAADEALRLTPAAQDVIDLWNRAA